MFIINQTLLLIFDRPEQYLAPQSLEEVAANIWSLSSKRYICICQQVSFSVTAVWKLCSICSSHCIFHIFPQMSRRIKIRAATVWIRAFNPLMFMLAQSWKRRKTHMGFIWPLVFFWSGRSFIFSHGIVMILQLQTVNRDLSAWLVMWDAVCFVAFSHSVVLAVFCHQSSSPSLCHFVLGTSLSPRGISPSTTVLLWSSCLAADRELLQFLIFVQLSAFPLCLSVSVCFFIVLTFTHFLLF